jgi:hypothetical protein
MVGYESATIVRHADQKQKKGGTQAAPAIRLRSNLSSCQPCQDVRRPTNRRRHEATEGDLCPIGRVEGATGERQGVQSGRQTSVPPSLLR